MPLDWSTILVHSADGVLVCNKPAGMATSGRSLDDPDCLQGQLIAEHRRMVWAVHQLDAGTSGLNVFVQRRTLVAPWQQRLRWPNARKTYLAVVHGEPAWTQRLVEAPLGPLDPDGRLLGVTPRGKPAATELRVLDRGGGHALIEATLRTGRTHQIRIHLAHVGHPLVGEPWYRQPPCTAHPRQALHAHRLQFADALAPARLDAPVPDDLLDLLARLALRVPSGDG